MYPRINHAYSQFDFRVNADGASDLSGLAVDSNGLLGGADGLSAKFTAVYDNAAGAYASEADMSTSGKRELDGYGADLIDQKTADRLAHVENAAALDNDHLATKGKPLGEVDNSVKSVTPAKDTASNYTQAPLTSAWNGVKQIGEGLSELAGLSEGKTPKID